MMKNFKKKDGYLEEDFLHFGYDHIDTGLDLLKSGEPGQFDSAGTLIHLGFEQVLKAWHLHYFKEFSNTHNLIDLTNLLTEIKLTEQFKNTLEMLNKYFLLRYPRKVEGPIEIGNDDIVKIEELLDYLWKITPNELIIKYENINPYRKGGRVTMKKPVDE
jgi:HEPN domain-containing protein